MSSTGVSLPSAVKSRLAMPHSSVFRLAPTSPWDFTEAFAGAGALRSSTNDLLTFLAANLGYTKTPLSGAMARMVAVRRDATDSFKIGLGWRLEPQEDGMEIVWHGGASYGSRTFTGFDAKSRANAGVARQRVQGAGRDGGSTQQSIQGVWQAVEITITGPPVRTITVREPRPNLTIITARSRIRSPSSSCASSSDTTLKCRSAGPALLTPIVSPPSAGPWSRGGRPEDRPEARRRRRSWRRPHRSAAP